MSIIQKVIQNRLQAEESRKNEVKTYPTEEILGSMKSVKDFAAFGLNHKEELEVIKASLLLDYCNTGKFTPEELEAFRLGQDSIMFFFQNAESDMTTYLEENSNKKKSVG